MGIWSIYFGISHKIIYTDSSVLRFFWFPEHALNNRIIFGIIYLIIGIQISKTHPIPALQRVLFYQIITLKIGLILYLNYHEYNEWTLDWTYVFNIDLLIIFPTSFYLIKKYDHQTIIQTLFQKKIIAKHKFKVLSLLILEVIIFLGLNYFTEYLHSNL